MRALLISFALLFAACASSPYLPGASRVKVADVPPSGNCEFRGVVSFGMKNSEIRRGRGLILAKNEAVKLAANYLQFPNDSDSNLGSSYRMRENEFPSSQQIKAFRCP